MPVRRFAHLLAMTVLAMVCLALAVTAVRAFGEKPPLVLAGLAVGFIVAFGALLALTGKTNSKAIGQGVGIAANLAVLVALLFEVSPDPELRLAGPPICQGVTTSGREFTAATEDVAFAGITELNDGRSVPYRSRTTTESDFDVQGRLLPGLCLIGFEAFCIGQPVPDLSNLKGPMDQQWFVLPERLGYVAGGSVQELAPGTIGKEPVDCPGGRPEPRLIRLTTAGPRDVVAPVTLTFDAPDAITVGAAAFVRNAEGNADWIQLGTPEGEGPGVDVEPDNEGFFALEFDPADLPDQSDVTLLFTVCWAGNVPGRANDQVRVNVVTNNPGQAPAVTPTPTAEQLRDGTAEACAEVSGGA